MGSNYTWWNEILENGNIFLKRLDRVVVNQEFFQIFPNSEVQHLARSGLDHAPLHVIYEDNNEAYLNLLDSSIYGNTPKI